MVCGSVDVSTVERSNHGLWELLEARERADLAEHREEAHLAKINNIHTVIKTIRNLRCVEHAMYVYWIVKEPKMSESD